MFNHHPQQFFIAFILSFIVGLIQIPLSPEAHHLLSILVGVFYLWIFSSLPLPITGIIGVAATVLFKVQTVKDALSPFASPVIFLFMGSFFLAKALEIHQVDKFLAYRLSLMKIVKGQTNRLIIVLILLTAFFSYWLSNTTTTAIFLPIALGLIHAIPEITAKARAGIVMAIGYSATLGGNGTPVGSPPNIIGVEFLKISEGIEISMFDWIVKATPLVFATLAVLIAFTLHDLKGTSKHIHMEFIRKEIERIGKFNRFQLITLVTLLSTIGLWLLPGICHVLFPGHAFTELIKHSLDETLVVLITSSFLFIFTVDKTPVLTWEKARDIDWATLLLFGAGISLGNAIFATGLAKGLSEVLASVQGVSPYLVTIIMVASTIAFTELVSNTAAANMLLPIFLVTAKTLNLDVVGFILPATIACNMGFMMPVGTPPNAMIYGTGLVKMSHMMKRGFLMNVVCGLLLVIWSYMI